MTESQVENAFQDLAQSPPAPSTETGPGLEHASVKDESCEQAEEEAMTDDDVVEPILTHGDAQNMYFDDSQLASPQTAQDSDHPDSPLQDSQPPGSQIPTDSQLVMPSDSQVEEPQPQDMPLEDKQQTEQAGVLQHHQKSEEKPDNQETPEPALSPRGDQVDVLDSDEEDGKKRKHNKTSQGSKAQKGTFKEHKHISSACQLIYSTIYEWD